MFSTLASLALPLLRAYSGHVLDHRQQSAISVGTGDYLNVYLGETSSAPLGRAASSRCLASGMHGLLLSTSAAQSFGEHRLDDHHWPITFDGM